jgi:hypothetical protein
MSYLSKLNSPIMQNSNTKFNLKSFSCCGGRIVNAWIRRHAYSIMRAFPCRKNTQENSFLQITKLNVNFSVELLSMSAYHCGQCVPAGPNRCAPADGHFAVSLRLKAFTCLWPLACPKAPCPGNIDRKRNLRMSRIFLKLNPKGSDDGV